MSEILNQCWTGNPKAGLVHAKEKPYVIDSTITKYRIADA